MVLVRMDDLVVEIVLVSETKWSLVTLVAPEEFVKGIPARLLGRLNCSMPVICILKVFAF